MSFLVTHCSGERGTCASVSSSLVCSVSLASISPHRIHWLKGQSCQYSSFHRTQYNWHFGGEYCHCCCCCCCSLVLFMFHADLFSINWTSGCVRSALHSVSRSLCLYLSIRVHVVVVVVVQQFSSWIHWFAVRLLYIVLDYSLYLQLICIL